ncbi:MAG: hypothetical protein GY910_16990 [bacterium]|nr:hypothetical protein [bacterium]
MGISAWTRRDRLERIASAERDRRAGRIDLAIAVLGEGTEWPARVVLSLTRLAPDEGAEARAILERGLDDWAAESGIDPLDPDAASGVAGSVGSEVEAGDLDSPIEPDEFERAFAQAEAQTDEMRDVNRVAEQILSDEPAGLEEIEGQELAPGDRGPGEVDPPAAAAAGVESRMTETDAVWSDTAGWLEPTAAAAFSEDSGAWRDEESIGFRTAGGGRPSREVVVATLERWLVNLDESKLGRAQ